MHRRRRPPIPPPWWLRPDLTYWAPLADPANPLSVHRGGALVFVRATAALRWDGAKFVSVGNNVLRIESRGALIEGQRTAYELLYGDTSQDLLAQWTKVGITSAFEADATGYGGTRWVLTADASDRQFIRGATIAAAPRALAFYVRRPDGGVVDATICNIYREGANRASAYTLIGNGIYRVSEASFNGSAGAANTGLTVKAGKTVHLVAPATLENGAFCAAPIPTADAQATRNTDVLTLPTAGNISGTVGTVAVTMNLNVDAIIDSYILNLDSANYAIPLYYNRGVGKITLYDGANRFGPSIAAGDFASHKLAASWSGAESKIAVDGVVVVGAFDGDMNIGATAKIGGNPTDEANLWGHIRDVFVWSRDFTAAEIGNITR